MPLYDFRCADCRGEREVRVPLQSGGSLELICMDCGGSMTKAMTKTVSLVSRQPRKPESSSPASAGRRSRAAAGHSCSDGAVDLERPNPFASSLPVNGTASGAEQDG